MKDYFKSHLKLLDFSDEYFRDISHGTLKVKKNNNREKSLSCQETESILNSFKVILIKAYIMYNVRYQSTKIYKTFLYANIQSVKTGINIVDKFKRYVKIVLCKTPNHYCMLFTLIFLKINSLVNF